jgi:hypothetical protein
MCIIWIFYFFNTFFPLSLSLYGSHIYIPLINIYWVPAVCYGWKILVNFSDKQLVKNDTKNQYQNSFLEVVNLQTSSKLFSICSLKFAFWQPNLRTWKWEKENNIRLRRLFFASHESEEVPILRSIYSIDDNFEFLWRWR